MIAYRIGNKAKPYERWFVASLPTKQYGECGKRAPDYGYVTKIEQALPLTPYWQKRFTAYMRQVNDEARFIEEVQPR